MTAIGHTKTFPALDDKTSKKIVDLYQKHGLTVAQLKARYKGIASEGQIAKALKDGGITVKRSQGVGWDI